MAASLLATDSNPGTGEINRFERLMPQILLSNGVAKTTARNRFTALNEQIQACLAPLFPADYPLQVEDWAVSNGITAAEWFQRLLTGYPRLSFTASDWTLYLIEAARQGGPDTYILEPGGTPIQYIRPPFVISLVEPPHPVYVLNRRLFYRELENWRQTVCRQVKIPSEWSGLDGSTDPVLVPPFALRRLPLIHPEVLALRSDRFGIRRHSIFTAAPKPADMIRTMNILNRSYFSEDQLKQAVAAVHRSLVPGGVWIVGRTEVEDPPQHEVTIYRKSSGALHWEVLTRLGGGSEIDPLINLT